MPNYELSVLSNSIPTKVWNTATDKEKSAVYQGLKDSTAEKVLNPAFGTGNYTQGDGAIFTINNKDGTTQLNYQATVTSPQNVPASQLPVGLKAAEPTPAANADAATPAPATPTPATPAPEPVPAPAGDNIDAGGGFNPATAGSAAPPPATPAPAPVPAATVPAAPATGGVSGTATVEDAAPVDAGDNIDAGGGFNPGTAVSRAEPVDAGDNIDAGGGFNPGTAVSRAEPVGAGPGTGQSAGTLPEVVVTATRITDPDPTPGLVEQVRNQQATRSLRQTRAQSTDWRVRLSLSPQANYLYNDPNNKLLAPLSSAKGTDGIVFPYTPAIETAYKAVYNPYDLTHSNHRGYFYQSSHVDAVNIRALFTAQDTDEANYLLAVIHFLRSVTKMFYGQDPQRGAPPPLVFLSGYGDYQFQEHPCVVSQFNYSLPTDVDYIRAGSAVDDGTNFLGNRTRTTIGSNPLSFAVNRLLNNALTKGAMPGRPTPGGPPVDVPTYVPTRMEIAITLLPMQSRQQISTQFSLKGFADGNLLKGGFW